MAQYFPMSNRLANENSLYLKQHIHNPVDWWPWCQQAFDHAKRKNKLIIISIGYSSCHWCHVMAHESFDDQYIASLMNKHFVCIKVDREERPDIDQVYMEVVQMLTQRGGWPLNVFCIPDGRPFFAGTYFPPEDKHQGIIPWPQLLMRINDHFKKNPEELIENADNIAKNLTATNQPMGANGDSLSNTALLGGAQAICMTHDDDWGGFGKAPKFPPSMTLNFLLSVRSTNTCEYSNPDLARRIDEVAHKTLKGMAHGGLFDQIGGGFARYSVDKYWIIPHFEKMLYDNALLIDIYSKGFLRYKTELFQLIVEETVQWAKRDMLLKNGLFASSINADSEGQEGKYYVWRPKEVHSVLGENDGKIFCDAYNITENGNFEGKTSNPAWMYDSSHMRKALKPLRNKILQARIDRVLPQRDSKILVSWNSLMARGLAQAAFTFDREDWMIMATKALDALWENNRESECRLKSVLYKNGPANSGYLDDYAFYAEACLFLASKIDFFKPGTAQLYIMRAQKLIDVVLEHFSDPYEIGFFFTADDTEQLISRKKAWLDNALPAGNSSMVHCLSYLYMLTGDGKYSHELNEMKKAYAGFATRAPNAVSHALAGFVNDAMGLAVLKIKGINDLTPLRNALANKPFRPIFIFTVNDPEQKNGYQLCIGNQCLEVTLDLDRIISKLSIMPG